MAENPWGDGVPAGVWVFIAIYLLMLFGIGFYYGNQLRTGEREFTAKDHFLAGRKLGMFTTALSLYASSWSGYAEVGAPGESYAVGFMAYRRVPGNVIFASVTGWLAPRIHFYAHKRDYEGTADFISDRYRNTPLTLTIVFLQIFPVCLYVMGQLSGIGTTMASMSGGTLSEFSAALIFVVIMLFYEMVGGMHAIAKTDVIQGVILLFGFVLYLIFQQTLFGGLTAAVDGFVNCARLYDDDSFNPAIAYASSSLNGWDFIADLEEYPENYNFNYSVSEYYTSESSSLEEGYMTIINAIDNSSIYLLASKANECKLTPGNVIEPANAAGHLTVNPDKLSGWINYHIGSIPFIVYPHIMDRYYAAKDVKTLQTALLFMHFAVWISVIPATTIGMPVSTFVEGNSDMTNIKNSNSVYATFLMYMIERNAFMYIMGCLICAASFSAYMSTCDSGIMGFSSMISLDVLKHYVPPFNDKSDEPKRQRYIVRAGKVLSVIGAFIALMLVTVYEDFPLGDLYVWQGTFLFQSFPAFVIGMFIPWVCSYSVLIGCWIGFFVVVMMDGSVNDTILPNVFYAMCANIGGIIAWEIILRLCKKHPGFEPGLKPDFLGLGELEEGYIGLNISKVGGPINEPFRPYWMTVLVLVLCFLAIPYWTSYDDYDTTYTGGVPSWLMITFALSACSTCLTMFQCHFYYDNWRENDEVKKVSNETEMIEEMHEEL